MQLVAFEFLWNAKETVCVVEIVVEVSFEKATVHVFSDNDSNKSYCL